MNRNHWLILVGLIAAHVGVDAVLPPAMHYASPFNTTAMVAVHSLLGVCVSQVNLIAMWAVFAPGAVAWRIPWAVLLGMLMWCTLMISNRLTWDFPRSEALFMGGMLLGGIVAAQIPLWVMRLFLHYRFYPPGERGGDDGQFNMRQLLSGIGLCCVGLALMQAVLPTGQENDFHHPPWWVILGTLAVIAAVNLLLTLPCTWLALTGSRRRLIAWGTIFLVYAAAVTVIEILVISLVQGRGRNDWDQVLPVGIFNVMQGASIALTLAILRASGFAWERREAFQVAVAVKEAQPPVEAPPAVHPLDMP